MTKRFKILDNKTSEEFFCVQILEDDKHLGYIAYGDNQIVDLLNSLNNEVSAYHEGNKTLHKRLLHYKEENEQLKHEIKDFQELLAKNDNVCHDRVINLIDEKIEEFKNGDYGDLPCNTIHMFLDLKEELKGDVE